MSRIVDVLKAKEAFVSLKGAAEADIFEAEKDLGVTFNSEYRDYVAAFGAASYYGHELTGVCKAKSLNVARITSSEREYCNVPAEWYVIELAHIDGIVFWQASNGVIYQTGENSSPKKKVQFTIGIC